MENVNNFFETSLERIVSFLPAFLGAILVLIIGLLIAGAIRKLISTFLNRARLNAWLSEKTGHEIQVESAISKLVYYILVIIVLLITLNILGVEGVLSPLQNMVDKFLLFVPNIVAAAIIGFVGYILAKVVSEIVGALARSLQSVSDRLGFRGNFTLDNIIRQIVFILIFVPILIVALDALNMNAISEPATNMLNAILGAIPNILAGIIILVISYVIARFLTPIFTDILKKVGTDSLATKMGINNVIGPQNSLSEIAGKLLFFFIMFFGLVSALDKMELDSISALLAGLLELAGQILFGLIIVAVGNFIANIAYRSLSGSAEGGRTIALIARYTVLGLFIAIALRTMGIANDIVNLAFGLTLGAAAVAVALSFGLGGREAAGKQMEYILSKFRGDSKRIGPERDGPGKPGGMIGGPGQPGPPPVEP